MRVVGLVGMRQHAVGERGFNRSANDGAAGDRRDLLAAVHAGEVDGEFSRRQLGSGDRCGQRVENHVLGLLDHRVGQRTPRRFGHVGRERGHQRTDRGGRGRELARKQRRDERTAGGLEQFASIHKGLVGRAFQARLHILLAADAPERHFRPDLFALLISSWREFQRQRVAGNRVKALERITGRRAQDDQSMMEDNAR